jgi:predicted AAA+ superfamily ATPase
MQRPKYLEDIEIQFRIHPVCALLGPRQVGKTTLARMYLEKHLQEEAQFFDLENPLDLARLENPMLALSKLSNQLIVIDEIQRRPELFPVLRVLVDEPNKKRKFLVLGSASRDLIRQSPETLAGRIGYIELMPFSLDEAKNTDLLWLRGGFPRAFLAANNEESFLWRQSYITTFLERDIPHLGFQIPPQQIRRFWLMLVHYHGQIFNASELGKSLGISDHTVRRYLDILAGTFMVRILAPWFENLEKRQVKSPKIYFRDSGILHALLGIQNEGELDVYPKLGSFWEGFALEEVIRQIHAMPEECYFWATQSGAELDLLIVKNGKRMGFEFKYTDAPKVTSSMKIACNDLKLDHLYVIFPGKQSFPLTEQITACGLDLNPFKQIKS